MYEQNVINRSWWKAIFLTLVWVLVLFIVILVVWFRWFVNKDVKIYWEIYLKNWESFNVVLDDLWLVDKYSFKIYIKLNSLQLKNIKPWKYIFNWYYSKKNILDIFERWPNNKYINLTILEWRSIYDIDNYLVEKWLISKWDYIKFVDDVANIRSLVSDYVFLQWIDGLNSLEWFLYPDTYKLDSSKPVIEQLVNMQLNNFQYKVWEKYKDDIDAFSWLISKHWYDVAIDRYGVIILASIIEKEEKVSSNKANIAWIFLNRLSKWMRLDADISLCYWLKDSYINCTPKIIKRNLSDESNKYNTRIYKWLTPTPIWNPSLDSLKGLLNYYKSDNLFYLHDCDWNIHVSQTNTQHNMLKQQYLSKWCD